MEGVGLIKFRPVTLQVYFVKYHLGNSTARQVHGPFMMEKGGPGLDSNLFFQESSPRAGRRLGNTGAPAHGELCFAWCFPILTGHLPW